MPVGTVAVKFVGDVSNLKRSLNEVDGSMGKLQSGLSNLKALAVPGLAAAGTAAVAFAASSVKAFAEAEAAQARLSDAFDKFPALADVSRKELDKLNESLALKTRFDDDATASAQAVLAQFGLTGKQIKALTPLMQDFAAKTGRDLPAAAEVLGKAILGQGRALKEVGLDFDDTGTKAGNFDQIMGGLRTQVGGFAEKEGQTAAGKLEILRNRFGEVQEKLGEKLLPVLIDFSDWLVETGIPAAEDFAEGLGKVVKWISDIPGAVDKALGPLDELLAAVPDFLMGGPREGYEQERQRKLGGLGGVGRFRPDPWPNQAPGWHPPMAAQGVVMNVYGLGAEEAARKVSRETVWQMGRVA